MALHNQLGKAGELAACRYLEQKGYRILALNWHCRGKEIDIIASDRRHLVVVEVKSRTSGTPEEIRLVVDHQKRRHLSFAARTYISDHRIDLPLRYDLIVALYRPEQGIFEITHFEDSFREIDLYPITGKEIFR